MKALGKYIGRSSLEERTVDEITHTDFSKGYMKAYNIPQEDIYGFFTSIGQQIKKSSDPSANDITMTIDNKDNKSPIINFTRKNRATKSTITEQNLEMLNSKYFQFFKYMKNTYPEKRNFSNVFDLIYIYDFLLNVDKRNLGKYENYDLDPKQDHFGIWQWYENGKTTIDNDFEENSIFQNESFQRSAGKKNLIYQVENLIKSSDEYKKIMKKIRTVVLNLSPKDDTRPLEDLKKVPYTVFKLNDITFFIDDKKEITQTDKYVPLENEDDVNGINLTFLDAEKGNPGKLKELPINLVKNSDKFTVQDPFIKTLQDDLNKSYYTVNLGRQYLKKGTEVTKIYLINSSDKYTILTNNLTTVARLQINTNYMYIISKPNNDSGVSVTSPGDSDTSPPPPLPPSGVGLESGSPPEPSDIMKLIKQFSDDNFKKLGGDKSKQKFSILYRNIAILLKLHIFYNLLYSKLNEKLKTLEKEERRLMSIGRTIDDDDKKKIQSIIILKQIISRTNNKYLKILQNFAALDENGKESSDIEKSNTIFTNLITLFEAYVKFNKAEDEKNKSLIGVESALKELGSDDRISNFINTLKEVIKDDPSLKKTTPETPETVELIDEISLPIPQKFKEYEEYFRIPVSSFFQSLDTIQGQPPLRYYTAINQQVQNEDLKYIYQNGDRAAVNVLDKLIDTFSEKLDSFRSTEIDEFLEDKQDYAKYLKLIPKSARSDEEVLAERDEMSKINPDDADYFEENDKGIDLEKKILFNDILNVVKHINAIKARFMAFNAVIKMISIIGTIGGIVNMEAYKNLKFIEIPEERRISKLEDIFKYVYDTYAFPMSEQDFPDYKNVEKYRVKNQYINSVYNNPPEGVQRDSATGTLYIKNHFIVNEVVTRKMQNKIWFVEYIKAYKCYMNYKNDFKRKYNEQSLSQDDQLFLEKWVQGIRIDSEDGGKKYKKKAIHTGWSDKDKDSWNKYFNENLIMSLDHNIIPFIYKDYFYQNIDTPESPYNIIYTASSSAKKRGILSRLFGGGYKGGAKGIDNGFTNDRTASPRSNDLYNKQFNTKVLDKSPIKGVKQEIPRGFIDELEGPDKINVHENRFYSSNVLGQRKFSYYFNELLNGLTKDTVTESSDESSDLEKLWAEYILSIGDDYQDNFIDDAARKLKKFEQAVRVSKNAGPAINTLLENNSILSNTIIKTLANDIYLSILAERTLRSDLARLKIGVVELTKNGLGTILLNISDKTTDKVIYTNTGDPNVPGGREIKEFQLMNRLDYGSIGFLSGGYDVEVNDKSIALLRKPQLTTNFPSNIEEFLISYPVSSSKHHTAWNQVKNLKKHVDGLEGPDKMMVAMRDSKNKNTIWFNEFMVAPELFVATGTGWKPRAKVSYLRYISDCGNFFDEFLEDRAYWDKAPFAAGWINWMSVGISNNFKEFKETENKHWYRDFPNDTIFANHDIKTKGKLSYFSRIIDTVDFIDFPNAFVMPIIPPDHVYNTTQPSTFGKSLHTDLADSEKPRSNPEEAKRVPRQVLLRSGGYFKKYTKKAKKRASNIKKYTRKGRKRAYKVKKHTRKGRKHINKFKKQTRKRRKVAYKVKKHSRKGKKHIRRVNKLTRKNKKLIVRKYKKTRRNK